MLTRDASASPHSRSEPPLRATPLSCDKQVYSSGRGRACRGHLVRYKYGHVVNIMYFILFTAVPHNLSFAFHIPFVVAKSTYLLCICCLDLFVNRFHFVCNIGINEGIFR